MDTWECNDYSSHNSKRYNNFYAGVTTMKSRRGISSVVGTVFAIIALASTVGYITYSMNVLDNYNQSVLARSQQAADITKEKFQVSSVTFVNNKLNITVVNTGSLPVNFTKIWITNKSATTTAWVKSYTPVNSLAAPGNTLTNLGQGVSTWLNTNYPYHVKLVTSRGNTNEFDVNSVSTAPLNIQLLATPPNVPSAFKTQLIMLVTNNSTGTVTNLVPNSLATYGTPTATCTPGTVSPTKYNTLSPGSTAVFTWGVTATGGNSASCTLSASLQNGYSKNFANTTITTSAISLSGTTYSQNTGTLTINYTTFQFTQGSGWIPYWLIPKGTATGFNMTLTNSDPVRTFYLSNKTAMIMQVAGSASTTALYAAKSISSAGAVTAYTCTGYPTNDYCVSLAPGQSMSLYIGANGPSLGGTVKTPSQVGPTSALLLVYGKFDTSRGGNGLIY